MDISVETLTQAVRLAGTLAMVDDRAEFVGALPGLAELVDCDVLTYNEACDGAELGNIPLEHEIALNLAVSSDTVAGIALNRSRADFTETERALLGVFRAPLVASLQRARHHEQDALTERESQIMMLVATGRTDSAIARELRVSTRTICKHLEHVYRKLGVANRAAAVACFCRRHPGTP